MTEQERQVREVIAAWHSLPMLVDFALQHRGYGDSDGGFGVTYPDDVDADVDTYTREIAQQAPIPQGMVELYGYWGLPTEYGFLLAEADYLAVLIQVLIEQGYPCEALRLRSKLL